MKILRIIWLPVLMVFAYTSTCFAQQNDKKKASTEIAAAVNQKRFEFRAQTASPLSGKFRQLNSGDFGVTIKNDSVVSYLPYFGRAFVAPINITRSPLDFTTTKYTQTVETTKNGRWIITIKPNDTDEIREMIFDISPNGSAFLSVSSNNRQPISFQGYIVPISPSK